MTEWSPIRDPLSILTPLPSQTWRPTWTDSGGFRRVRVSASKMACTSLFLISTLSPKAQSFSKTMEAPSYEAKVAPSAVVPAPTVMELLSSPQISRPVKYPLPDKEMVQLFPQILMDERKRRTWSPMITWLLSP